MIVVKPVKKRHDLFSQINLVVARKSDRAPRKKRSPRTKNVLHISTTSIGPHLEDEGCPLPERTERETNNRSLMQRYLIQNGEEMSLRRSMQGDSQLEINKQQAHKRKNYFSTEMSRNSINSTTHSMPHTLKSKAKDMARHTSMMRWKVAPTSDFAVDATAAFNQLQSQTTRYQKHEVGFQQMQDIFKLKKENRESRDQTLQRFVQASQKLQQQFRTVENSQPAQTLVAKSLDVQPKASMKQSSVEQQTIEGFASEKSETPNLQQVIAPGLRESTEFTLPDPNHRSPFNMFKELESAAELKQDTLEKSKSLGRDSSQARQPGISKKPHMLFMKNNHGQSVSTEFQNFCSETQISMQTLDGNNLDARARKQIVLQNLHTGSFRSNKTGQFKEDSKVITTNTTQSILRAPSPKPSAPLNLTQTSGLQAYAAMQSIQLIPSQGVNTINVNLNICPQDSGDLALGKKETKETMELLTVAKEQSPGHENVDESPSLPVPVLSKMNEHAQSLQEQQSILQVLQTKSELPKNITNQNPFDITIYERTPLYSGAQSPLSPPIRLKSQLHDITISAKKEYNSVSPFKENFTNQVKRAANYTVMQESPKPSKRGKRSKINLESQKDNPKVVAHNDLQDVTINETRVKAVPVIDFELDVNNVTVMQPIQQQRGKSKKQKLRKRTNLSIETISQNDAGTSTNFKDINEILNQGPAALIDSHMESLESRLMSSTNEPNSSISIRKTVHKNTDTAKIKNEKSTLQDKDDFESQMSKTTTKNLVKLPDTEKALNTRVPPETPLERLQIEMMADLLANEELEEPRQSPSIVQRPLVLPQLKVFRYMNDKMQRMKNNRSQLHEGLLSSTNSGAINFINNEQQIVNSSRTSKSQLNTLKTVTAEQWSNVPFGFQFPVSSPQEAISMTLRGSENVQSLAATKKPLNQEDILLNTSQSSINETPRSIRAGKTGLFGGHVTMRSRSELQRASEAMRSQPFNKQQVLITEQEADLERIDEKKYRYNKKPKGFWVSVEQERELAEIDRQDQRMQHMLKQFNSTNSEWLLKGPYSGTGKYKKQTLDKVVKEQSAKKLKREQLIMRANNARSKGNNFNQLPNLQNLQITPMDNAINIVEEEFEQSPPMTFQNEKVQLLTENASNSKITNTTGLLIKSAGVQVDCGIQTALSRNPSYYVPSDTATVSLQKPIPQPKVEVSQPKIEKIVSNSLEISGSQIRLLQQQNALELRQQSDIERAATKLTKQVNILQNQMNNVTPETPDANQVSTEYKPIHKRILDLGAVPIGNQPEPPTRDSVHNGGRTRLESETEQQPNFSAVGHKVKFDPSATVQVKSSYNQREHVFESSKSSMRATRMNSTHLQKFKLENLDIQLRLSQEYIAELKKTPLTVKFALTYFDGNHNIDQVSKRNDQYVPEIVFKSDVVRLDSWGQLVIDGQRKINMFTDVFGRTPPQDTVEQQCQTAETKKSAVVRLNEEDIDYCMKKYVVEIEVIAGGIENEPKTVYLRYISLNQIGQNQYPKAYITILKRLSSRQQPLNLPHQDIQFEPMANQSQELDFVYDQIVMKDISFALFMKKNKKLNLAGLNGACGLVLETPKNQLQLISLNNFLKIESDKVLSNKVRESIAGAQNNLNQTLESIKQPSVTVIDGAITVNSETGTGFFGVDLEPTKHEANKFKNRFKLHTLTMTENVGAENFTTTNFNKSLGDQEASIMKKTSVENKFQIKEGKSPNKGPEMKIGTGVFGLGLSGVKAAIAERDFSPKKIKKRKLYKADLKEQSTSPAEGNSSGKLLIMGISSNGDKEKGATLGSSAAFKKGTNLNQTQYLGTSFRLKDDTTVDGEEKSVKSKSLEDSPILKQEYDEEEQDDEEILQELKLCNPLLGPHFETDDVGGFDLSLIKDVETKQIDVTSSKSKIMSLVRQQTSGTLGLKIVTPNLRQFSELDATMGGGSNLTSNNTTKNSREMLRPEINMDNGQKRTIVRKVDNSPELKIKVKEEQKDQLNDDSQQTNSIKEILVTKQHSAECRVNTRHKNQNSEYDEDPLQELQELSVIQQPRYVSILNDEDPNKHFVQIEEALPSPSNLKKIVNTKRGELFRSSEMNSNIRLKRTANFFNNSQLRKSPTFQIVEDRTQQQLKPGLKIPMSMTKAVIDEIPEELAQARHTNYSKMSGSQNNASLRKSSLSFHQQKKQKVQAILKKDSASKSGLQNQQQTGFTEGVKGIAATSQQPHVHVEYEPQQQLALQLAVDMAQNQLYSTWSGMDTFNHKAVKQPNGNSEIMSPPPSAYKSPKQGSFISDPNNLSPTTFKAYSPERAHYSMNNSPSKVQGQDLKMNEKKDSITKSVHTNFSKI